MENAEGGPRRTRSGLAQENLAKGNFNDLESGDFPRDGEYIKLLLGLNEDVDEDTEEEDDDE
ncbi:MAG TPA: hypothetical protein ENI70_01855 [Candidatus Peregrinibacteria bacterium]|nr:hypothetical protein [Candidatus Peregrinibacteria bacterium]